MPHRLSFLAITTALLTAAALPGWAQEGGNARYNQAYSREYQAPTLEVTSDEAAELRVDGLLNVVPDAYVAVFSATQTGTTADETYRLLRARITRMKRRLQASGLDSGSVKRDMISFVPRYDFVETEERLLSKTYQEVPTGFELQDNLLVRYTDRAQLPTILAAAAEAEIFDLVKVDCFVTNQDQQQALLRDRCQALLEDKLRALTGTGLQIKKMRKVLAEERHIIYPQDRYQSYQAYNRAAPPPARSRQSGLLGTNRTKELTKTTTRYYEPIRAESFDVVLNPVVDQAVVQFTYSAKLRYFVPARKEKDKGAKGRYFFVAPEGQQFQLQELRQVP